MDANRVGRGKGGRWAISLQESKSDSATTAVGKWSIIQQFALWSPEWGHLPPSGGEAYSCSIFKVWRTGTKADLMADARGARSDSVRRTVASMFARASALWKDCFTWAVS